MTNNQVISILRKIRTAYSKFEINEEVIQLWIELLVNMPYEKVLDNLNNHIKTNPYAPNVAQIAAEEKVVNTFIHKYEERLRLVHEQRKQL